MSLDDLLDRRLLIISGKGGVGKTTVAGALGIVAARRGLKVLLCEVEGNRALGSLFGKGELGHHPTLLLEGVWGLNISPEEALREYFEVAFHIKRIARPLITSQLVYYVTQAAPGLRDILMLGKVWHEANQRRDFDLVVLDTPASGHAVSMLRSPRGFLQAVPIGPLAAQARKVAEWLENPAAVAVHLVTVPEEMAARETVETTVMMEERLGMDVAALYINMIYPALGDQVPGTYAEIASALPGLDPRGIESLASCARFYGARESVQKGHRSDLTAALSATSTVFELPFLFSESFSFSEVAAIADAIEARPQ